MAVFLDSVHVFPVKGLAGAALPRARVGAQGLENDRRFGVCLRDAGELFGGGAWKPWNYFVSLKKHELAARLLATAEGEGAETTLTLQWKDDHQDGGAGEAVRAQVGDAAGWRVLEAFLQDALQMKDVTLSDCAERPIWDDEMPLSVTTLESGAALEKAMGAPMPRQRFRGNLVLRGAPAWSEEGWRGAASVGSAALTLAGGIPRCRAMTVNPHTARRDCDPAAALSRLRGHNEFGVFMQVARAGEIACGMEVTVESVA